MRTAVVWFRRDLRVHDHPAFAAAVREFDHVVPLFVLDPAFRHGRYASEPRTAFMAECLLDLDSSLRRLGSGLVVAEGRPEREVPRVAAGTGAETVLWTSDVSPYARARDRRVREALRESGIEPRQQPGNYVVDISRLKTRTGDPYRIFSPFFRNWSTAKRRSAEPAPQKLPALPDRLSGTDLTGFLARLGRPEDWLGDPAVPGGETAARQALSRWLFSGIDTYRDRNNHLAEDATSRLSPYLRWGCLSPLELEQRAAEHGGGGAASWIRQLCWRDFYAHVLFHWPGNIDREFQPPFRLLEWDDEPELLAAWQGGTTGYPVVDAAMRQLAATGWMHNRGRLIVGSFLTKDLQLDWRHGERWFGRMLLDGEPAQNNGNWQWIASVGTDPAPVSRRLYNPVIQGKRHDPEGVYVRRWIPELADVPTSLIHQPWTMDEGRQREAGCRIGRDYPWPVVDHRAERERALQRYGEAKRSGTERKEPA